MDRDLQRQIDAKSLLPPGSALLRARVTSFSCNPHAHPDQRSAPRERISDYLREEHVDLQASEYAKRISFRHAAGGGRICQTRDGSDTVLRRDLPEGEYNVATSQKLVYMLDQLDSVRDVLDASTGNLVESYDYTPYGAIARSNGSTPTDYQYAGLFAHPQSGLNFSATRAMDGGTGRWLNRDLVREDGGINLYGYVHANPVIATDQYGLWQVTLTWATFWGWRVTFGNNGGHGLFDGQWNFGIYRGFGVAASFDLDIYDRRCHKPTWNAGFQNLGFEGGTEIGLGGHLSMEAHSGAVESSASISYGVPGTPLGGSIAEGITVPTVSFGGGAFVGAGGTCVPLGRHQRPQVGDAGTAVILVRLERAF